MSAEGFSGKERDNKMKSKLGILALLVCCVGMAEANVQVTETNSVTGSGMGMAVVNQYNTANVNAPGYASVGVSALNNVELKNTGLACVNSANTVNANVGAGAGKVQIEALNNHEVTNVGVLASGSQNTVNLNLGMGEADVKAWNLDTVTNAGKADIAQTNIVNGYTAFGKTTYNEINQILGKNIWCEKGVQANINGIDPIGELNIKKVNMAFLDSVGSASNIQTNNIGVGICGGKLTLDMSNYIQDTKVFFASNTQTNNAYTMNFAPTKTKITLTNEADGNKVGVMLNSQKNTLVSVVRGSFSAELGNYGEIQDAGFVKFNQHNVQNIYKPVGFFVG